MKLEAIVSLVILGCALAVSLRLLDPEKLWRWNIMGLLFRIFLRLVFLTVIIGLLTLFMGFLSIPYAAALVVIWAAMYARARRARQNAVLELVCIASEHHLPLIPCLEAFAQEETGAIAFKADQLARDLAAGAPLEQAVQRNRGVLPRGASVGLAVGNRLGSMGAALRQLNAVHFRQEALREAISIRMLMLCALLFVGPVICTFIFVKIVPALYIVFTDFDSELPAMTQLLIDYANTVSPVLVLLSLSTVLLLGYSALNYVGWAPSPGWVRRQFERGRVLRALALGAERETPLPEVLATLTGQQPLGWVWYKLKLVEGQLWKGMNWCDSLRSSGLIRAGEAAILQAAERAGNLPWALREVASRAEERLVYRLELVLQIVSPLVVVLLGGVVGFIVIALFLPLVKLIADLS